MAETVSVRVPREELREIDRLSKIEKQSKSQILREVVESGIKQKRLAIALEKFRLNETTAWQAAKLAQIPLSSFMDALVREKIDFHYGIKELHEDVKGLN